MPKKRNFLGGMQNYNPNNGEYESALVGPNGKVAKDVDGDGKEHETTKQSTKYKDIFDADYQRSYGPENFEDEDDEEVLKSIISKAKELGDENILENAQDRLDQLQQEKTKKSFSKFGKEKIDEEFKPKFETAKQLDSLYAKSKKNGLSFERMLLNDIKENQNGVYDTIEIDNKKYVRKGNGYDFYKDGKHISFGTLNSVANDINQYYEDIENKLKSSFNSINQKRLG